MKVLTLVVHLLGIFSITLQTVFVTRHREREWSRTMMTMMKVTTRLRMKLRMSKSQLKHSLNN